MKWLIFDLGTKGENQEQFDAFNEKINASWGFPNEMGTARYADPVYHPDGILVAIPIMDEAFAKELSQDEQNKVVEDLPPDWTPKDDEPPKDEEIPK